MLTHTAFKSYQRILQCGQMGEVSSGVRPGKGEKQQADEAALST